MVEVGSAEVDVAAADDGATLAERLRARAPEACAELYDRYATGVHRFAMARLSGDVEAAEDVVVETMVGVVTDIRRFQPARSSLAAWVYGIARRWSEVPEGAPELIIPRPWGRWRVGIGR